MGKQYCVCHLLTGHSYYSFWFLGDSFFFNFESPSIAFLLLFKGFFFLFLYVSFKEIQRLRLPPPPCLRFADRLTLHAQPVRAVLGLQDEAIAVLASILGGGGRALPPAPVSALGPTGGPLAPGGPPAVHCHKKTNTHSDRSERRSFLKAERGRAHVETKHRTPKETRHQGALHSLQLLEAAHALHASCGFCRLSFQEAWG